MFDSIPQISARRSAANTRVRPRVMVLFGTRPEAIKLAPVIHELGRRDIDTTVVSSSQHRKLLKPFLTTLKVDVDHDLAVMRRNQNPNEVCGRIMERLDRVVASEMPDLLIVQGDTTTTLAGALVAFNRRIPVAHVEAGLRTGDLTSPFPEEMNRRLVSQIASLHFAATDNNRLDLLSDGVAAEKIFVTGNTVVDSVKGMLTDLRPSRQIRGLIKRTCGKKRLLLTTHRRESFGDKLRENLHTIAEFVERHDDVCLFFPVHPNPNVKDSAKEILGGRDRVHLLPPLDYSDFLAAMQSAWLIVSDSGGVQEEAPTLGKPLLILREKTERTEAINAGVAKLVSNGTLKRSLEENHASDKWIRSVMMAANPFGDGHSAARIVSIVEDSLPASTAAATKGREKRLLPPMRVSGVDIRSVQ